MSLTRVKKFFFIFILATLCFLSADLTQAYTIDELNKNIENTKSLMEQNQKEIEKFEKEIENTGRESATLENKIKSLKITSNRLASDIKLTQNKIKLTKLNIDKLESQINFKYKKIETGKKSLREFIKTINEIDSNNLIELMLAENFFSDFFSNLDNMDTAQEEVKSNLVNLKKDKLDLEKHKQEKEIYKKNTEELNNQYLDQKKTVEMNRNRTSVFLNETKNKESNYKNLLANRMAKQKAFEDEIKAFENQIQLEIDRSSLPEAISGILKWPLEKIKITQYFGHTAFAQSNKAIYKEEGHNGIDLRAAIGVKTLASSDGVVTGVGDTDRSCSGVSYGKWILIKHPNRLSTLYAHLSAIKVVAGQKIEAGQLIGYTGDTGYATGPHLHFGVFATEGVEIKTYRSKICGTNLIFPIKTKNNAVLDPLLYL